MDLKEELIQLSTKMDQAKLDKVVSILKKAASNKQRTVNISDHNYDRGIINWLEAQNLDVKETSDQRDGDFITVTW